MRWMIGGMAALCLTGAAPATGQDMPSAPGWMAGCWQETTDKRWTEECWTIPRGGMLMGSGRSGSGDMVKSWEVMQIIPGKDGMLAFWGSPGGAPRIAFPVVSHGASEIVFANPAHDYPQRIRYWRDGEALNAEISLADGSKAMRWTYRRM